MIVPLFQNMSLPRVKHFMWKWVWFVNGLVATVYIQLTTKFCSQHVLVKVPLFHVHTSLQGCSFVLCFTKLFSDRNLSFLQWLLLVRKHLLHVFLLFLYSCLRETFNSNNTLDKSYNKSGALMIDKIYSKQTMIMSNKPWSCQTNKRFDKQHVLIWLYMYMHYKSLYIS